MNDIATNDLVVIEPTSALSVFTTAGAIDPLLDRVRKEIDAFKPDISTVTGRKAVASMAYRVARAKTYLDDAGKRVADQQKEIPKKIDATRKRIRDTLDAWRDEVRAPLDQWEAAEAARIEAHKERLETFRIWETQTAGISSDTLRSALTTAQGIAIDNSWEEFVSEAALAKDRAIASMRAALVAVEKREAEADELARLRAEAAAREQKDREEKIAREATERAQRDAEAKAVAAARAAEDATRREREASERRELELKLAAEQAERRAAEAETKAKRDAEAKAAAEAAETACREADKAHRGKVNRAALDALVAAGIGEEPARRVIELIATKQVPHVSINY